MRRVFIVRKDLHMTHGKLAAQIGHCCEIYWLRKIQNSLQKQEHLYHTEIDLPVDETEGYILNRIVKTVCQCKNLNQLLKAKAICEELGLKEGEDFGLVNDACFTELTPENPDGTCTTCLWTKPLEDNIAHKLSRKYHLYEDKTESP